MSKYQEKPDSQSHDPLKKSEDLNFFSFLLKAEVRLLIGESLAAMSQEQPEPMDTDQYVSNRITLQFIYETFNLRDE